MNIRSITKKDKPAIKRILKHTPEFTADEVALAVEVIDSYLFDPAGSGYFTLVAEVNSQLAGYVCFGPTPITEGVWDVYWIAVDSQIQGQGIGRQLMTARKKNQEANGRLILVGPLPGYEKTNAFYQRIGYKESCRIKDFYMVGIWITYEKRFTNPIIRTNSKTTNP
jgi:GNAT superfamily N-acetyltransferase